MTARRNMIFYCVTLVVVTLLLITLNACQPTGGSESARATYGAQQFRAQLTAQAVEATRSAQP